MESAPVLKNWLVLPSATQAGTASGVDAAAVKRLRSLPGVVADTGGDRFWQSGPIQAVCSTLLRSAQGGMIAPWVTFVPRLLHLTCSRHHQVENPPAIDLPRQVVRRDSVAETCAA